MINKKIVDITKKKLRYFKWEKIGNNFSYK